MAGDLVKIPRDRSDDQGAQFVHSVFKGTPLFAWFYRESKRNTVFGVQIQNRHTHSDTDTDTDTDVNLRNLQWKKHIIFLPMARMRLMGKGDMKYESQLRAAEATTFDSFAELLIA